MPRLDEGSFLYMPSTMPHVSFAESLDMLHSLDAQIARIPEVAEVVGKAGRAESPLDPAPISMFEVLVRYRDEYEPAQRRPESSAIGGRTCARRATFSKRCSRPPMCPG